MGMGNGVMRDLLWSLARQLPTPLNSLAAMAANHLEDLLDLADGIPHADDPDAWDPEYIRETLPLLRAAVGTYHRAEVRGIERIPDGASLLVGNHSGGTVIVDTFVFALEFYAFYGPDRRFHQLAHDVAARMPFTGIRRYGVLAASHDNARRAFALDAPVLVYPGGDYESFRPSWHSERIEFGDRKGWVRLALESGVPVVPVVSLGGQETALFLTRGERAARATGLADKARIKVLPVSIGPPFGLNVLDLPGRLPAPAKITLEVLEPIDLVERFGPDPDVDEVYDVVTTEMQDTLSELADDRTLPVVG
jgi:1-acyl-sn-glycerol-3-phosphate acyltransferase